jgi:lysophospholipase L1-like esterase
MVCALAMEAQADEIITFGDSITKGTPYLTDREGRGRVGEGGYQPYLDNLLKSANRPSRIYNWGVAGESTLSGFARINNVLSKHPQADYILILEGTNDWALNLPVSSTVDDLELMIERSLSQGVEPIVATLPPATNKGSEKMLAIQSQYNPKIRAMANRKGVLLADMYNAMAYNWESLTYDGTHPNRSGYSVMARVWFNALHTPVVRTTEATNVSGSMASLNGLIRPNTKRLVYFFQYGPTINYGKTTQTLRFNPSVKGATVSMSVADLNPQSAYHYRLVARTDQNQLIEGNDVTINTGAETSDGGGCFISSIGTVW